MKKINIIVFICFLMINIIFIAGCEIKHCPDGKDCNIEFTGTGINSSPIIHSSTRCNSSECDTNKSWSATSGNRTNIQCKGCKN